MLFKTLNQMENPFLKHSRIKIFTTVKIKLLSINAYIIIAPKGVHKTCYVAKL